MGGGSTVLGGGGGPQFPLHPKVCTRSRPPASPCYASRMALTDWDFRHPAELQDVPWDCAAASLAWALQAAGHPYTEAQVVAGLGPTRISPVYGLLDASGAGIVDWLATVGIAAENNPQASWADVIAAAGYQPMLCGGRQWCHWTGVRLWGGMFGATYEDMLALANPAPGYMGVDQLLYHNQFQMLGPFSAVWFVAW